MNLSLDAFAADKAHKLDWMLPEGDERQLSKLNELTQSAGHIILGRKMAEESVPHWEKVAKSKSDSQEVEYAKFFVNTPKTVFSKSLDKLEGNNIHIERSDLSSAVMKLKKEVQKNIIVYGGAKFVSSLIEGQLIDELNLFFHPVSIGNGLRIFNSKINFELTDSRSYSNGIVYNRLRLEHRR